VVDVSKCNWCNDCISPCPTGSIDNWRKVPRARAYSLEEQLGWDELPAELSVAELAALAGEAGDDAAAAAPAAEALAPVADPTGQTAFNSAQYGATLPPWSAAHAYTNLYGPRRPRRLSPPRWPATCASPRSARSTTRTTSCWTSEACPSRCWRASRSASSRRASTPKGKPHHARQYSIASPRNGERPGYNNLSLTVKRVLEDHQGQPVRGVGSNYMCDLKVGDKVQVIGPFGASFLMPNHPRSHIVMICTGTGSAPMRAMTEWRRRLRASGKFEGGKLMLFFGARTKAELPYFGPLQNLPKDFIDINFAFSRTPGQPKRYVQDLMRERAADLAPLLQDGLRGLGGAGFPAGRKWRIVREPLLQPQAPRLMAVNIDEGEPGTFKDRTYLERDPHRFLEGVLIAAQVVGTEAVYIYLRDEYHGCRALLQRRWPTCGRAAMPAAAHRAAPRRGRLHLRRRVGHDRKHRRQTRRAPHAPALHRAGGPVRPAHAGAQLRDAVLGARHRRARPGDWFASTAATAARGCAVSA
jgi:benzoyl-CoA 2,3-dioxygenase component A